MPITRSTKGTSRQQEDESSEGATGTTATGSTEETTTSGETEATETATESTEESTASKEKTKDAAAPSGGKEWRGSNMTMVPVNPPRAPSVRSTRSIRRKELEAKEELARLELEQAKAAAAFARAKLERLQLDAEVSSDEDKEPEERTNQIQDWVQTTVQEEAQIDAVYKKKDSEIKTFAKEIVRALTEKQQQPAKYLHELPFFDGNSSEWIAFKTVYQDTAGMFTSIQNVARIRKAVKGQAREAIKSLLYSDCSPADIIEALRRRFGRPDALVLSELEKLKTLSKPTENARDICIFANQVTNSVAAIKGLEKPQYLHSPETVKIIVDKLPSVVKYRWYDYAAIMNPELPELENIAQFLNREADRCGAFASPENTEKSKKTWNKQVAHAASEKSEGRNDQERKYSCPQCKEEHFLDNCPKFKNAPVQKRWDLVKSQKLCFKCLRSRHRKETCRRYGCSICKRWHHQLLHSEARQTIEDSKDEESSNTSEKSEVTTNLVAAMRTDKAYLKMLPVKLYGPKKTKTILALLDEGSTVSLLDMGVAQEIGAEGPTEAFALETVGGKRIETPNSKKVTMKIQGVHQKRKMNLKNVRTIKDLKLMPQQIEEVDVKKYPHLEAIAHEVCYKEEPPKLLIGQDNWELIVTRALKRGKTGHPVASMTSLGWVLHGNSTKPVNFVDKCLHISEVDEKLEQLVKDHFSIESLGVAPKRPTTDADAQALKILDSTSRRLEDGRFEVGLLWKRKEDILPENQIAAERRLSLLERKLEKNEDLKKEYTAQIHHLLKNGYAERAPKEQNKKKWYLPHFAVTHPQKKKIRVVFDAAAKVGGKSLNDMLLPGPDLLQSLFGVLLRFREGPVAVTADIKEMFLQIRIIPEDRDCLRFLWRDEKDQECKEYRMTSVIFGATSSPCTAIYIKNKNGEEAKEEFPDAAKAIVRNHYMDDYLHSFRSSAEAKKTAREVDIVHRRTGFELRGWASNKPETLQEADRKTIEGKKEVDLVNTEEKTLGMKWITTEDTLGFNINLRNTPQHIKNGTTAPTKRQVTSAVMSTFDPMGLLAPVLIQGKKLMQNIWRSGVGWDEEIKQIEQKHWEKYMDLLQILKDLKIPRCIAPHNTEGELHIFCDASETAYSSAAYWRTTGEKGDVQVTLIAGKARVTPLKPISIPRLELQAALLSTRLARTITEELELQISKTTYWTDSTTVLAWIQTDPRTFKTFVAHRLAEIEESTKPQQWRWVPTTMNPADDATRKTPNNFNASHRWFNGPPFLYLTEEDWPKPKNAKPEKTGEEKEETIATATTSGGQHEATPDPTRFSKWNRLLRATARILQFVDRCKPGGRVHTVNKNDDPDWKKAKKPAKKIQKITPQKRQERNYLPLEAHHMEKAEMLLVKQMQEESFGEEIQRLKRNEQLPRNSRLKKLDITVEEGLIRLRGRINAVQGVNERYKRPVIIDGRHTIGRLLIAHYHQKYNHGNHLTVMNEIRQRFHVIGLRTVLRSEVRRCQWCRTYKTKPSDLPPGDLPSERLKYGSPPFECTAVDYFGPMTVTVGRRHEKRWGALFTCLTVRAVHIELASSLSADSMILALRRFAARRGMPKTIYSDNGTNFVGANRELREALEELKMSNIISEAEPLGVTWKFIPPGAPNMGGAWERMVRSIKVALEVTLRERHPKEEVLHTLLLEAEHTVNSRPLTELQDDQGEEALTPNHFLIGRSSGTTRLGIFTDHALVGKNSWKTAQRLADHFWSRWVREYLPTLLPRRINGKPANRQLREDDIVVIGDHTLPRGSWPRGMVKKIYPGPDGVVRVADVETSGGVLRRPAAKLVVVVPCESPNPESGAAHEGENVGDHLSNYR